MISFAKYLKVTVPSPATGGILSNRASNKPDVCVIPSLLLIGFVAQRFKS